MKRTLALLLTLCILATFSVVAFADADTEPVTLTLFYDHTWIPTDSFTGIIPEEITRLTGVTLDVTFALDGNQLGVMAASGDLPDLVYTQNMVDRLSTSELCYSLEDLIAEYNVDWNITPQQLGIARGLSSDGKAYTVLNHVSTKADWENSNSVPMLGTIVYRKDLLDEMGNPAINDLDSFYAVLEQAHAKYPELVTLTLDQWWNVNVFRYLTGIGGCNFLEQDDGSYIHYAEDPRWEQIMKWLNKCYRAGFMSTDDSYFVNGSKAITADMYVFGCCSTQNNIASRNVELKQTHPDAVFYEMVPWDTANYTVNDAGWSGLFITKTNKNPEASIKFMAWMFTPEAQKLTQMGREGIDYTLNDAGQPMFSDEWKQAMTDGTHDKMFNPYFYFGGSETVESDARCATLDPTWVSETYAVMRERYDNYPWISAAQPVGDSDEKVIWDEYQELLNTYEHKIILAATEEEADALISEFRANAERVGLPELDAYMTARVAELMPMYS